MAKRDIKFACDHTIFSLIASSADNVLIHFYFVIL